MPHNEPYETRPVQVVGIGASAGGLEAFTRLLAQLPADTGLAFVLVQHLDPDHRSHLPEILSRATKMSVETATDGALLTPNHIYVAPPHVTIAVFAGRLHVTPRTKTDVPFLPIDSFFRSLAQECHDSAIGVVLSGSGSDGTAGLAAIKVAGGLTIAQEPASAQFKAMPEAAVTGGVDFVLTPENIGAKLSTTLVLPAVSTTPPPSPTGERSEVATFPASVAA